jgi:ryanodine receptor 2
VKFLLGEAALEYRPQPIDTAHITLGDEVLELTELLARNTHEVWARARMSQGWTYGPARDDEARTHPDLLPYEALTETEKDYDRSTALETLRTIVALGFSISRDPASQSNSGRNSDPQHDDKHDESIDDKAVPS